jgi:hypothetical protein
MEPLFGLKPEVANTIITAIASLLSAFLGGYIAARATKKSTERALASSLAVQEDNRRAVLRGVILGIRTELEAILELYRSEMETELSELKSGEGVWITLPIYQSYFTVYESNCSLLGQINNDELRKAIIQAYLAAKSLINTHQHNNQLIANHDKLVRESAAAFMVARAKNEVNSYGSSVMSVYDQATKTTQECLSLINRSELLVIYPNESDKAASDRL